MVLIKKNWLDYSALQKLLQKSFQEFDVTDLKIQQSILAKYATELDEKNLLAIELYEKDNLVASAISVYKRFYSNCGPLRLSFLTQVIVQEQFRGKGYLKLLMESVKESDIENSSLGSVVIARRKIGDMYYKFGYKGFGIFPKVIFETIQESKKSSRKKAIDLELTAKTYEITYGNIAGSIYRADTFWKYIRDELLNSRYFYDSVKIGSNFGYFIYYKNECIEIAGSTESVYSELIEKSLNLGVDTYKIGSNHPAFQSLIDIGGAYSIRPEPTEGHLLKPYQKGNFLFDYLSKISKNLADENKKYKYSIDINLLNEW